MLENYNFLKTQLTSGTAQIYTRFIFLPTLEEGITNSQVNVTNLLKWDILMPAGGSNHGDVSSTLNQGPNRYVSNEAILHPLPHLGERQSGLLVPCQITKRSLGTQMTRIIKEFALGGQQLVLKSRAPCLQTIPFSHLPCLPRGCGESRQSKGSESAFKSPP